MPKLDGFKKFMEKIDGTQRDVPEKEISWSGFGSRTDGTTSGDGYSRYMREELERRASYRDRRDVQMGMHSQRPMWRLDDEVEDAEHSPSDPPSQLEIPIRTRSGGSPAESARDNLREPSRGFERYVVRSTPSGAFSWEEFDRIHREHIARAEQSVRETLDREGS